MDRELEIAEELTVGNWLDLQVSLESGMDTNSLWEEAFSYFTKRMESRYLMPVKVIETCSNVTGEGFSIVTIICSLIEALESFYQGRSYRKPPKGCALDITKEYFKSQEMFESFLINREPFSKYFSEAGLATSFYENVRCALLHEAATRNGWKIRIDTSLLIEKREHLTIVNRVLLVLAVDEYMKEYKKKLFQSVDLKQAFMRKFNAICLAA